MPRKRSSARQRIQGLQDWKLQFLLTGEEPEPAEDINPFEALTFCHASPDDNPARWGRSEPWFRAWEWVKDTPAVRQWRKDNGTPWAEKNA